MPTRVIVAAGPYDAEFIRRTLQDGGYVTSLWDGRSELRAAARELEAAALVVSQRLAQAECVELLAALRADEPESERLPVLLISDGRSEVSTLADAVRVGADQMLLRPIEPLLLLSKLDAMVAHSPRGAGERGRGHRRGGARRPERGETLPVPTTAAEPAEQPGERSATLVGVAVTPIDAGAFAERVEHKLALVREGSYFALLGLPQGAGATQVQSAYHQQLGELDPECVSGELSREVLDALTEVRAAIEEAFVVLSDDAVREAYVRAL